MGLTFDDIFTITSIGNWWEVMGEGKNDGVWYGCIIKEADFLFRAHRQVSPDEASESNKIPGYFASLDVAAHKLALDYHQRNGGDYPLWDNTTEEAQKVMDESKKSVESSMPSVQVVYDAHIAVNIYPDGTARAEVLLANYDEGPHVTDAEGRSIERGTVLHKAAWDAAADLLQQDSYALPLEVKA